MVLGPAWHQGGALSHSPPLVATLQAGHCEEGARGQEDEVGRVAQRVRGQVQINIRVATSIRQLGVLSTSLVWGSIKVLAVFYFGIGLIEIKHFISIVFVLCVTSNICHLRWICRTESSFKRGMSFIISVFVISFLIWWAKRPGCHKITSFAV